MNPNFGYHLPSGPTAQPSLAIPSLTLQSIQPIPATSPQSQSVPGRRTPLGTNQLYEINELAKFDTFFCVGAVGIGGFYAQGTLSSGSHTQTDENQPSGSRERWVIPMPTNKGHFFLIPSISILLSFNFLLDHQMKAQDIKTLVRAIKLKADKEKLFG